MYKNGCRLMVALLAAGLLGACASQDWDRGGGGGDMYDDQEQEATSTDGGGGGGWPSPSPDPTGTPEDDMYLP